MSKYPKFLVYKAKLDAAEVTAEQVTNDLTLMAGQMALENGKHTEFSYTPIVANVDNKRNETNSRYGNLLAKFEK